MHRCIRSDEIPFGFLFQCQCHKTFIDYRWAHNIHTPWVVYGSREQPVKSTIENESGESNEQRPDEKSFIHFWFACFVCIVLCGCRKGNGRWESKRANCDLCADAFQEISMVCEWFHFISSGRVKCQASQGISIIVIKHYHLALLLISVDTFSGDFFPSFSSSSVDAETEKKYHKKRQTCTIECALENCTKICFYFAFAQNRWHRYGSRDPNCASFLIFSPRFFESALEMRERLARVLAMCCFLFTIIENTRASDQTRPGCYFCELRRCFCRCAGARARTVRNDCLYFVVIFDSHQDTQRLGNRLSPYARCWKKCGTWNVRCNHSHTIDCSLHLTPMCASFTTSNVNFICFTCVNFHLPWIWRCAIDVCGRFVLAARNCVKNK